MLLPDVIQRLGKRFIIMSVRMWDEQLPGEGYLPC
jgi:hypothetical protein